MSTKPTSKWRAAFSTRLLTDALRGTTLAAIEKAAGTSTLLQIPSIAASYAALVTKGTTLATNVGNTAAAKQVYVVAHTARDVSRSAFDLELLALKTLVEANSANAADLTGMGFTLFSRNKASHEPPDPPVGALIVQIGKAHGKARVTVPAAGNPGSFAAQMATDPTIGPATVWSSLPGRGRQRKLAAPTGTKLWVRFATVRFGMQSEWGTPVLITMP